MVNFDPVGCGHGHWFFHVTVDSIEKVTKIDFFHNLPDSLQFRLEGKIDLKLWKF